MATKYTEFFHHLDLLFQLKLQGKSAVFSMILIIILVIQCDLKKVITSV